MAEGVYHLRTMGVDLGPLKRGIYASGSKDVLPSTEIRDRVWAEY